MIDAGKLKDYGMSYKEIASYLGCDVRSVPYHLKNSPVDYNNQKCIRCGQKLEQPKQTRKPVCFECKKTVNYVLMECLFCKGQFLKPKGQKYCSYDCLGQKLRKTK